MVGFKEEKELFVSGLDGTSPAEILLLVTVLPLGSLCFVQRNTTRPWILEVMALLLPLILTQTVWLDPWGLLYLLLMTLYGGVSLLSSRPSIPTPQQHQQHNRTAMTLYRSGLLWMTCIAILAVDFHLFPRRYAKTERYGYSLMDSGAASFVVAAGWVGGKHKQRQQRSFPWRRWVPLVVLGSLRFWTHQELDYQEHVTEYGLQWNFFATLAVVTSFVAMVPPTPHWKPPVAALLLYQVALSMAGLQEWIEDTPRTCGNEGLLCNLFVANREGILGCIGYLSIYYACSWISHTWYWTKDVCPEKNLWKVTGALFILWRLLIAIGVTVSRRSTNSAFCVWVLFLNVAQISAIRTVVSLSSHSTPPPILAAINSNGLLTFVIANLLTGAVNLSMDTFHASNRFAIGVLVVYMVAVSGVALLLNAAKHLLRGIAKKA